LFLTVLQFLFTIYFIISGILLDDAFYNYSYADIKFIIETTSVSFTWILVGLVFFSILIYYIWEKTVNRIHLNNRNKWFLLFAVLATIFHQRVIHLAVNGDFGLSIQVNKSFYFFNRTTRYLGK